MIKGNLCARKSKEITSLMKMRSTLNVPQCITKGVLAIVCSNSFSHYKGDQKKTVAISQMFSHVQLHVHWMHLLNTRICRYIEDIYFFEVNTKCISSNVLKISVI